MKPDWNDAPDWASWLAQDESGAWHWFSDQPYYDSYKYRWRNFDEINGRKEEAVPTVYRESTMVEKRP